MVAPQMLRWAKSSQYASAKELYRDLLLPVHDRLMLAATLYTFDEVRRAHGGPLLISSGRRSQAKQQQLIKQGYRAATFSAHTMGVAIDVVVPKSMTDEQLVLEVVSAAVRLDLPRPRIGWMRYRVNGKSPIVHFDFAFLLQRQAWMPGQWFKVGAIW